MKKIVFSVTLGFLLITVASRQGFSQQTDGQVGTIPVSIISGDMTRIQADAYIVPHFNGAVSEAGVGGAVLRAGAADGIKAYSEYVAQKGPLGFGNAWVVPSGGGGSRHLINVVSLASSKQEEFSVVGKSIFNALIEASKHGIDTVATPALGTGLIGNLQSDQSARAIMSGIKAFSDAGNRIGRVSIIIFRDQQAYDNFGQVLSSGSYATSVDELGQKEIDPNAVLTGMFVEVALDNLYRQ